MRVVVAPNAFGGTLTATEAARAIADGWRRRWPDDELVLIPMSDGGPGFVDAVHGGLGGVVHAVTVPGPLGNPVPATLLLVGDTAYVEAAQACGLHLLPRATGGQGPEPSIVEAATTLGVGRLVEHAIAAGAATVVTGLGGSGTNDAGAGLLAALGATATPADALTGGPRALDRLIDVDVAPAYATVAGVRLVAAGDVTNPLLGLRGATNVYGPQKGLDPDRRIPVDGMLTRFAHALDPAVAARPGAGAAGGLGFALLLLGAELRAGVDVVLEAAGAEQALSGADLVLTGEGRVDPTTFAGKAVHGVARRANAVGAPCVVIAGAVDVGSRELRAGGIEAAYGLVELVGRERALAAPASALADAAERVSRTWGRR